MSADNWAICPTCSKRRGQELQAMEVDTASAYGSVPVEEFDAMRAELEAFKAAEPEHTFREDYEFWGAETGVVHVSYRGACSVCKTSLEFREDHAIEATP